MIKKNIVFLSYGSSSEFLRAIYCILSLSSWADLYNGELRLIIYTDQPDFFKTYLGGFNFVYVLLTSEMFLEMDCGKTYIHRRKVAVIDMTFTNYPDDDLIFIDSDTFFTAEPTLFFESLSESNSLMHKEEYKLSEGLELFRSFGQGHFPEAFINHISGREYVINGQSMIFNADDKSYNSGVLGLSKEFRHNMQDVFNLTDDFYEHSKWFISEQLAFSLILQRTTTIITTDKFITHYWGAHQKRLMDKLLTTLITPTGITELTDRDLMRKSVKKMQHLVDCDLISEQLEIALDQRDYKYAAKKRIQLFLLKFFKITIGK